MLASPSPAPAKSEALVDDLLSEPKALGYTTTVATVHTEAGFKVRVLNKDHFPAHVHVIKAGTYAKILISGMPVVYETNMSRRDSDTAKAIVTAQLDLCRKKWIARYGHRTLQPKDKPKPRRG